MQHPRLSSVHTERFASYLGACYLLFTLTLLLLDQHMLPYICSSKSFQWLQDHVGGNSKFGWVQLMYISVASVGQSYFFIHSFTQDATTRRHTKEEQRWSLESEDDTKPTMFILHRRARRPDVCPVWWAGAPSCCHTVTESEITFCQRSQQPSGSHTLCVFHPSKPRLLLLPSTACTALPPAGLADLHPLFKKKIH